MYYIVESLHCLWLSLYNARLLVFSFGYLWISKWCLLSKAASLILQQWKNWPISSSTSFFYMHDRTTYKINSSFEIKLSSIHSYIEGLADFIVYRCFSILLLNLNFLFPLFLLLSLSLYVSLCLSLFIYVCFCLCLYFSACHSNFLYFFSNHITINVNS